MIRRILSRAALTGVLFASLISGPAEAQQRIIVREEAGTPVVATTVLLATGPAQERDTHAGITYLSARAVVEPIRPTLDSLGARLEVETHKDAMSFTLVAAPDVWDEAVRVLFTALFRDPPEGRVVEREQRAILAELLGRAASPSDALTRQADAALFGRSHPWGRPTVGTAETIQKISVVDVDMFLRRSFVAELAAVSIVGPLDEARVTQVLSAYLVDRPDALPDVPAPRPAEEAIRQEYNSITTWLSISYLFPEEASPDAVGLLARIVSDDLSFGPRRRSVYNVRADVIRRTGGGEIRFQLVVPPEEAERWAEQVHQIVRSIAQNPLPEREIAAAARRYRGERLRELATPESRSRALARSLLLSGRSDMLFDVKALTPETLQSAARQLGGPVTVFLGPFAAGDE